MLLAHGNAANLHDRRGAPLLIECVSEGALPRLELVQADGAYAGTVVRWLEAEWGWHVEVPKHGNEHRTPQ